MCVRKWGVDVSSSGPSRWPWVDVPRVKWSRPRVDIPLAVMSSFTSLPPPLWHTRRKETNKREQFTERISRALRQPPQQQPLVSHWSGLIVLATEGNPSCGQVAAIRGPQTNTGRQNWTEYARLWNLERFLAWWSAWRRCSFQTLFSSDNFGHWVGTKTVFCTTFRHFFSWKYFVADAYLDYGPRCCRHR